MSLPSASDLLDFWRDVGPDRWFKQDSALDAECRERFGTLFEAAEAGGLADWADGAEGALALVILLDQMPRNMFRGTRRAFATDPLALATARGALAAGFDAMTDRALRPFFYLPFMHAEDREAQAESLRLFRAHGDPENLRFAEHHAAIVERFGRFPHRNAVLGRATSEDEQRFLAVDPFRG